MNTPTIDRIGPTRRPAGKNAGTQRWLDLAFVHFEVDPAALRRLVPPELELDLWQGRALVGVVPFRMTDVRPWWLPRPFAQTFAETNVRVYVVRDGLPGVYFFSLEAASFTAVQAARLLWGLPYHHATMSIESTSDGFRYSTVRRSADAARLDAQWTVGERLGPSEPESLQFFLLERYLLYTVHNGRVKRGQVYHTPYPAHAATLHRLETNLLEASGFELLRPEPVSVLCSPGVDVEVFALRDA